MKISEKANLTVSKFEIIDFIERNCFNNYLQLTITYAIGSLYKPVSLTIFYGAKRGVILLSINKGPFTAISECRLSSEHAERKIYEFILNTVEFYHAADIELSLTELF